MEVKPDDEIYVWLQQIWNNKFDWDDANTLKLCKHSTTKDETESIFKKNYVFWGKIVLNGNSWGEDRYAVFGETKTKRLLTIVFTIRNNLVRAISCRSMRNNEKKIYSKKIKRSEDLI